MFDGPLFRGLTPDATHACQAEAFNLGARVGAVALGGETVELGAGAAAHAVQADMLQAAPPFANRITLESV
ncbi:MAG: hypothetical protein IPL39_18865 [Opitutaceae bacterium]|nr:hypothetical protein [Opitutaceae bacterium]